MPTGVLLELVFIHLNALGLPQACVLSDLAWPVRSYLLVEWVVLLGHLSWLHKLDSLRKQLHVWLNPVSLRKERHLDVLDWLKPRWKWVCNLFLNVAWLDVMVNIMINLWRAFVRKRFSDFLVDGKLATTISRRTLFDHKRLLGQDWTDFQVSEIEIPTVLTLLLTCNLWFFGFDLGRVIQFGFLQLIVFLFQLLNARLVVNEHADRDHQEEEVPVVELRHWRP